MENLITKIINQCNLGTRDDLVQTLPIYIEPTQVQASHRLQNQIR